MADKKVVEVKSSKKSTNPLIFVGIGCLVILVILGVAGSFVMKFIAKKAGTGLLQNIIEKKTGVKTNLQDIEKGKMTFTDEKTGTKIDIGTDTLPASFPKDFPIYPGANVTGVLSGTEQGKSNGFWVTLTTGDSAEKVVTYYSTNLKNNGWDTSATFSSDETTTQTVSKGTLTGTVGITQNSESKETDIVIMIGEDQAGE